MAREIRILLSLAFLFLSFLSMAQPLTNTLRVLSYNIHHGEGLDKKVNLERIAALIRSQQADIAALQEVDQGVERTDRRDLPAELAQLTGMTCVFSNNYSFQGGQYGNAVLTRFPVKTATNLHYKMLRPGEQRGMLQLVLDVHGRELIFLNTHLDFRPDDSERLSNVEEIRALARRYQGRPVILCGDFNDTPGSRTHKGLGEDFEDTWLSAGKGDGYTIPVLNPAKRIDYIWLSRGSGLRATRVEVLKSEASDHLPILAEIQFANPGETK
jgi:endonuclease/exonuclease/phosphatase family metal-dependent hydrolase